MAKTSQLVGVILMVWGVGSYVMSGTASPTAPIDTNLRIYSGMNEQHSLISRTSRGTARVRGYYDVHPDRDSRLTLNPAETSRWGDPLPVVRHKIDAASQACGAATRA